MADLIRPNDPGPGNAAREEAFVAALRRVLASNQLILGPEVEAFEREFATSLGGGFAVGVASGTDAVELALRVCGVQRGDAVITAANTASGTLSGIERAGAVPILADVDARTFTLCPDSVGRCLRHFVDRRVRALLPVHLFGQMADLGALLPLAREHGLCVVEDCAQAHGASQDGRPAGTVGDAGAFSFYPTKNLGALGDGGAVWVRSEAQRERLLGLRQYGWRERYVSEQAGLPNSRLDELQAAFLRLKLPALATENARRRALAERYRAALAGAGASPPYVAPGNIHVYHQFTLLVEDRERWRARVEERGIGSAIVYPMPVHRQPAYRSQVLCDPAGLPVTDSISGRMLSLPVQAGLTDAEADRVCAALGEFAVSG